MDKYKHVHLLVMPFQKRPRQITSMAFSGFMDSVGTMSENTVKDHYSKIRQFESFCKDFYKAPMDQVLEELKAEKNDRYKLLTSYASYLKHQGYKDNYAHDLVKSARGFLEFNDIEFSERQLKHKVRLPRKIRRSRQPISKDEIRDLLLSCSNIWLKTFIHTLAATGARPIEICAIRHQDLLLDGKQPMVTFRAEFTKMRQERQIFLTDELAGQMKKLLEFKLRERTFVVRRGKGTERVEVKPESRPGDLLFSIFKRDETAKAIKPRSLYTTFSAKFQILLDSSGRGGREDHSKRRRITFYSMRRWVKSTISDLGYRDFSEWQIGHAGSVYYSRTDKERIEVFRRIEPYLTFLAYSELEAKGQDTMSRLEALQQENHDLKDMLIATNDAVVELRQELHDFKRKR